MCDSMCTVDYTELGHQTWTMLHTLATTHCGPLLFQALMVAIANIYPCVECQNHMNSYLTAHPVTQDVPTWLCHFHNNVNKRLNKTIHPCGF